MELEFECSYVIFRSVNVPVVYVNKARPLLAHFPLELEFESFNVIFRSVGVVSVNKVGSLSAHFPYE